MPECDSEALLQADRFGSITLFCGFNVACGNGFILIGFKACE
jgi:hypothetical protein